MTLTREMYIPENAKLIDSQATDTAIYFYENNGAPCAMAFSGRKKKPNWRYRFRSDEQRQQHVDEFIKSRREFAQRKEAERLADLNHGVKPGDIFYSSWGYDQTNVNFYKVVSVVGKVTLEVVEVGLKSVQEDLGHMISYVIPDSENIKSDPFYARLSGGSFRATSYSRAYKWDGRPEVKTSYR